MRIPRMLSFNRCIFFCIIIFIISCQNNNRLSDDKSSQNHKYQIDECKNKNLRQDSVVIHDTIFIVNTITQYIDKITKQTDTIYREYVIPIIPTLDSVETVKIMQDVLANGYITIPLKYNSEPSLSLRSNLELLPYLTYLFSQKKILPKCNYWYLDDFEHLCSKYIDDIMLLELGQSISDNIYSRNLNRTNQSKRRLKFDRYPGYKIEEAIVNGIKMNIDSLRVRVIAYKDLDALNNLESYYVDKGYPLGIAIYYKLLLKYGGFGDFAEKFYQILKPYIKENPDLNNVVRETLLRAALCDHSQRAKELCDSLGYSFCDY